VTGWNPSETSKSASVGELNPNCEAQIVAPDGKEVTERNARGELWVRAPNVMKGYWRNEKATKETLTTDGWLRTGDVAFVDDDGKIHVVDRMKVSILFREERTHGKKRDLTLCRS
jgi:4-coumarate--CoA ligase